TAEDIDAEIDELLPFLGAGAAPRGPKPNPQQGVPSLGSGGTLWLGRVAGGVGELIPSWSDGSGGRPQ
ncbi:hypothetical protein, partial [Mycolicibacterium insubricum]|uniref:hypothetical protein n=1 Tax=Mycolicibacterium insubricum TaxID=444597 RepID=UPI0021F3C226